MPPFGTMAAIDTKNQKLLWHRSMGTPEQFGPLGMKTHMPIELGMPTLGGATPTASGLVFFSATSDYYLRAIDVASGEVVWKNPLPIGAGFIPLVFMSPEDGRQYVVVTANGARAAPDFGDCIIALALPNKRDRNGRGCSPTPAAFPNEESKFGMSHVTRVIHRRANPGQEGQY
jgi:quinate dehydrogenase (quinone)